MLLANTFKPSDIHWQDYDVIYYTGGHGVMWDFLDNSELQEITKNIYEKAASFRVFVTDIAACSMSDFQMVNDS